MSDWLRVELQEKCGNEWKTSSILTCKASVKSAEDALFAVKPFRTQLIIPGLEELFRPIAGQGKGDAFTEGRQ